MAGEDEMKEKEDEEEVDQKMVGIRKPFNSYQLGTMFLILILNQYYFCPLSTSVHDLHVSFCHYVPHFKFFLLIIIMVNCSLLVMIAYAMPAKRRGTIST